MATINQIKVSEEREEVVFLKFAKPSLKLCASLSALLFEALNPKEDLVSVGYGQQRYVKLIHGEVVRTTASDKYEKKADITPSVLTHEISFDSEDFDADYVSREEYEKFTAGAVSSARENFEVNEKEYFYDALKGSSIKGDDYYSKFAVSKFNCNLNIYSKKSFLEHLTAIQNKIEDICNERSMAASNIILLLSPSAFNKAYSLFENKKDVILSADGQSFNYLNFIVKKDFELKNFAFIAVPKAPIIMKLTWSSRRKDKKKSELSVRFGCNEYGDKKKALFKKRMEYINILPDACISGEAVAEAPAGKSSNKSETSAGKSSNKSELTAPITVDA